MEEHWLACLNQQLQHYNPVTAPINDKEAVVGLLQLKRENICDMFWAVSQMSLTVQQRTQLCPNTGPLNSPLLALHTPYKSLSIHSSHTTWCPSPDTLVRWLHFGFTDVITIASIPLSIWNRHVFCFLWIIIMFDFIRGSHIRGQWFQKWDQG